jgi:hypothetical protein
MCNYRSELQKKDLMDRMVNSNYQEHSKPKLLTELPQNPQELVPTTPIRLQDL